MSAPRSRATTRQFILEKKTSSSIRSQTSRRGAIAYVVIFLVTLALTPGAILAGANQGYAQILAAIAAIVALALIPWRPIFGLYLIVACAVVIEQEPLPATPIGTDHLYIFYWPTKLQGLPERPIGFVIIAIFLIIIVTQLLRHRRPLYGGRLIYSFMFFFVCLAIGVLHGLASGGTFRIIVLEIRPFWYFFVSYVLAYNIVSDVKHVRTILWIVVLGTAIKGVQGVFIIFTFLGGHIQGHNEIMAHEQSFFFVLVLLILVMMLLHHFQRGLFIAILISLPTLLIALVANNRRADYVALFLGIGVAWLLVILIRPQSRRVLVPILVGTILFGAIYVVAFQKSSSPLGQPARAVVSVFNPSAADERDTASNAYRIIENYDLKFTESQSPLLGYGFGKPFIQTVPLPNVSQIDPYYLYIPHNNVLWVWMRLGPIGFGALWYLIGTAIVTGCLIARRLRNPHLQFFAIFAIAAVMMEVILAYGDYQFFFYRNMIFIGITLGVLLKLPAIERASLGEPEPKKIDTDFSLDETPKRAKPRTRARLSVPMALPSPAPAAFTRAEGAGTNQKWNH
jgi:hypothetical protein